MKMKWAKTNSYILGAAFALSVAGQTKAHAQVITADGSSTVYPITEAVAEEYQKRAGGVKVTVGISGTGGGFKKFVVGDTDISDASRPIKATEAAAAAEHKIEYIELPIAYDAITVVVSKQNTWCKFLTKAELKAIWEPTSKITNWSQVRVGFPDVPLKLYGPGTDSGTFDYFTDAINGKERASRADYTASEDDNVLVQGVSKDTGALGYFGLAYYEENKDKLNSVAIDNGNGAIQPAAETVVNGTYQPLSRPLFIYINKASAEKAHVASFVRFYLGNVTNLSRQVGYIPLPKSVMKMVAQRYNKKKTGSIFGNAGSVVGVQLKDLLRKEQQGS